MKVSEVAQLISEGKEFTTEEVEQIMLDNGMSSEKLKLYRSKGYDDNRLLALLRF